MTTTTQPTSKLIETCFNLKCKHYDLPILRGEPGFAELIAALEPGDYVTLRTSYGTCEGNVRATWGGTYPTKSALSMDSLGIIRYSAGDIPTVIQEITGFAPGVGNETIVDLRGMMFTLPMDISHPDFGSLILALEAGDEVTVTDGTDEHTGILVPGGDGGKHLRIPALNVRYKAGGPGIFLSEILSITPATPAAPVGPVVGPVVGQEVSGKAQYDALPVGSQVFFNDTKDKHFEKEADGRWISNSGMELAWFNSPREIKRVGPAPIEEQLANAFLVADVDGDVWVRRGKQGAFYMLDQGTGKFDTYDEYRDVPLAELDALYGPLATLSEFDVEDYDL